MSEHDGILGREGKRQKLEDPARVRELDPAGTLARIGLRDGQTLCDIGAGSGLFSLAAARITRGTVWAADTDGQILAGLAAAAAEQGLSQLRVLVSDGRTYALPDGAADWALLVTTVHEIGEREALFAELWRLLAPRGRVCLIEFHRADTPKGPPLIHRLGAAEARVLFAAAGFDQEQEFSLGENLYCQTYVRRRASDA